MMPIRLVSWEFPFHLGRIIAFSGCNAYRSATVSIAMTLDRSRFKYEISCKRISETGLRSRRFPTHLDNLTVD